VKPRPISQPMIGEQLHKYDLEVCDYILGNIRPHLDDTAFAAEVYGALPPRLEQYLRAGLQQDSPPELLLLDDVELDTLESALTVSYAELDRFWVPYDSLYGRHLYCVREIRDGLTRQAAEDWSLACAEFARRLNARHLHVFEGIGIAHDWVRHIRRLKRAMGASRFLPYPDGPFPTPTTPTPWRVDLIESGIDDAGNSSVVTSQTIPQEGLQDGRDKLAMKEVLASVGSLLEVVTAQRVIRDYYSTEQAAQYLGKAHWTVREWCRLGRVHAEKRFNGRGKSPEWVLSHAELQRIQKEGLLPRTKY